MRTIVVQELFVYDRSMIVGSHVAEIASLIGEPARANMLVALMDGRAFSATELAFEAGVTPQTASVHLAKLVTGRLVVSSKQGRHHYFRLAGRDVAEAIETIMAVAANGPPRYRPPKKGDSGIRSARTCYDHLAGRLGVTLTEAMVKRRILLPHGDEFRLTRAGEALFQKLGIEIDALRNQRRLFARQCLDWSERRPHLAGALGAAFASRCFEIGWIEPMRHSRAVRVTDAGMRKLGALFKVDLAAQLAGEDR